MVRVKVKRVGQFRLLRNRPKLGVTLIVIGLAAVAVGMVVLLVFLMLPWVILGGLLLAAVGAVQRWLSGGDKSIKRNDP